MVAEGASGSEWLSLPTVAMTSASLSVLADRAPPPSLADLAPRVAPAALMLVYRERGQELERRLNPVYARTAGPSTVLWKVPGSAHIAGLRTRPAEYEQRVVGFLDDALLDRVTRPSA